MTREQVHDLMENELRCVQRGNYCDRDCAKCPLVKDDKELIEAYGYVIKALEQETVSKEDYDHEYFLRKEFELKIYELQRQLEEQEQSRDMEEIEEIINCDVDAEIKCKMISNISTAKPHYFEEPFINKPCVSSKVCEHDKNKVLDKIRAEIEQIELLARYTRGDIKQMALNIIDKYKAEVEPQESEG